jgi:hypothetical protein
MKGEDDSKDGPRPRVWSFEAMESYPLQAVAEFPNDTYRQCFFRPEELISTLGNTSRADRRAVYDKECLFGIYNALILNTSSMFKMSECLHQ